MLSPSSNTFAKEIEEDTAPNYPQQSETIISHYGSNKSIFFNPRCNEFGNSISPDVLPLDYTSGKTSTLLMVAETKNSPARALVYRSRNLRSHQSVCMSLYNMSWPAIRKAMRGTYDCRNGGHLAPNETISKLALNSWGDTCNRPL